MQEFTSALLNAKDQLVCVTFRSVDTFNVIVTTHVTTVTLDTIITIVTIVTLTNHGDHDP